MPNDLLLLDNFIGFGKNGKSTKRLEDFGMDETLQFVKTHGEAATKEWKKLNSRKAKRAKRIAVRLLVKWTHFLRFVPPPP